LVGLDIYRKRDGVIGPKLFSGNKCAGWLIGLFFGRFGIACVLHRTVKTGIYGRNQDPQK